MGFRWGGLLGGALVLVSGSACWGQARAKTSWRETTFDGSSITVRYNGEGGSEGSISAPFESIDVAGAQFCRDCNGGPTITLSCKDGAQCVTGNYRDTGLIIVGEGEKLNREHAVAADNIDVVCDSVTECEAFLQALKDATGASSTYTSRGGSRIRENAPADEPVIDGSKIPKEIDFTKTGGSSASAPGAPSNQASDPLSSYLNPDDSTKMSAFDPKKLATLFDSEASTQAEKDDKERRQPLQIDVKGIAEKYGPAVFDGLNSDAPKTPIGAWRYVAGEWLTSLFSALSRNETSYAFTGKSFDELPDTFKKDYAVWDGALKRILNPFSAKRGYTLVDEFGKLFDLWEAH